MRTTGLLLFAIVALAAGESAKKSQGFLATDGASQTRESQSQTPEHPVSVGELAAKAMQKAFKGGLAGFIAGIFQVLCFMWLRTIMNRQYYKGGSTLENAKELFMEGGVLRFYQGFGYAVIEAPISRFGDTFSNGLVLALLAGFTIHPLFSTVLVAVTAASWRVVITPIDTFKTTMQVQGEEASRILWEKVQKAGIVQLWTGAGANFVANVAGNYPWWATFNTLQSLWAIPASLSAQIVRNGVIGICSSITSDCVSNVFRVLKTVKQASPDSNLSYLDCAQHVIKTDGILGLFGRGLGTRVLVNMMQGTFFTIAWKLIEGQLNAGAA